MTESWTICCPAALGGGAFSSSMCLSDAIESLMLLVLDFNPVFRPAAAIGSIGALGDQTLEAELAGLAEQVRANLALLEVADEDAVRPARQQPLQVGLPQRER